MSAEIEIEENTAKTSSNGVDKIAGKIVKTDDSTKENGTKLEIDEERDAKQEQQVQNGKDVDAKKENEDELLDELEEDSQLLNLTASARMISLKMLLQGKVLQPGKSVMTIEYLGQKFFGDLLEDGRIKSQETEAIFCSPSAWAINCKRIINPDKKSGVGWSSIKYKGKKLDVYKALYQKKCLDKRNELDSCARELEMKKVENKPEEWAPPKKRVPVPANSIDRSKEHDINTLVEAVPFQKLQKIQPFMVNFSNSAVLLMDFHCHLSKNEVCGYFGGTWDLTNLSIKITHAFPCLSTRYDRDKAHECELQIQRAMSALDLSLVGWYHSHPYFNVNPTVRDCDSQLKYQMKIGGTALDGHTPCIGVICAAYDDQTIDDEDKYMPFWVYPPTNGSLRDVGKPVIIQYTVTNDTTISDNTKAEMENCFKYYKKFEAELVDFRGKLSEDSEVRHLDRLKQSLFPKLPTSELWNWVLQLIGLDKEDPIEIPQTVLDKVKKRQEEAEEIQKLFTVPKLPPPLADKERLRERIKEQEHRARLEEEANRATLNAISCLQQQLSLPSGLNMTPSPISSSIILPSTIKGGSGSNRSNNISKQSTGKLEVSIRATPSPARSDYSQKSHRSSPAAQNQNQKSQGSSRPSSSGSSSSNTNINDIYAATLASLAAKLPPGLLPNDLLKTMPDYGLSALNALTQQAAMYASPGGQSPSNKKNHSSQKSQQSQSSQKQQSSNQNPRSSSSSSKSSSWFNQIPNMKEFMAQLEKGDLSVLMQSPYNIPTCKSSANSSKSERNHPASSSSSSARTNLNLNYQMAAQPGHSNEKRKSGKNYDYENYKEAGKIADLMKSPEYTQMLLQQAQAFRGLGSEITVTRKPSATVTSQSQSQSQARESQARESQSRESSSKKSNQNQNQSSILQNIPLMDLNSLAEMSKSIPELNALLNSNKPEDINALLQMQMMSKNTMDYAALFGGNTSKNNKLMQEYANALAGSAAVNPSILSQYMMGQPDLSSLFGPMSSLYGMGSLGGLAGLNMIPQTTGAASSLGGHSSYSHSNSHAYGKNYGSGSGSSKKKESSAAKSSSSHSHPSSSHSSSGTSHQASSSSHSKTVVAPNAADMLNSLFAGATGTSSKSSNNSGASNSLLKSQDLSSYFGGGGQGSMLSSPSTSKANNSTSGGGITAFDYSSFFSHMSPAKIQEMSALFSQNKYPGIPDPLAKSTLAANNMYLSPSLMKLQQEALNTMLMKPPKSSSSSSSSKIETPPPVSASPSAEKRSTPTKSESHSSTSKYPFSAADLAISSVPLAPDYSRKSSGSSSGQDYHSRKSTDYPYKSTHSQSMDFSRKSSGSQDPQVQIYKRDKDAANQPTPGNPVPIKKRMEFSSIAELIGSPPSKVAKYSDDAEDGALNLSNN